METKAPVLLVVLIESVRLRWLAAAITLDGQLLPLVASADGDLEPAREGPFDERVSFLRHRLSGVLQRGCDRLWPRQMKACQIVFIAEPGLDEADAPLTQALADHFVEWLTNPPVAFLLDTSAFATRPSELRQIAGALPDERRRLVDEYFGSLIELTAEQARWELIAKKPYSKPST